MRFGSDMVNVTRKNFIEQSNDLLKHLPDAAFCAIDEEMTGIQIGRLSKDDTPEQRYSCLKEVPERYAIIQVGVCLFHKNPEYHEHNMAAEYLVRRYNFYVFPPSENGISREITMNPSSITFLNEHGMDFNLWTKEGIPYLTTDKVKMFVDKYKTLKEKDNNTTSTTTTTIRDPTKDRIILTRQDDVQFHARAMASLREWIDGSIAGSPSLLLPACNGFLRKALYQSIELEYPALIWENGGAQHRDRIRVWRLSNEEKKVRKERLEKEAWERLVMNIGFWRVFKALSNANKGLKEVNSIVMASSVEEVDVTKEPEWVPTGRCVPIVCHNGLMDIMFLLTHFHSHQLPNSYLEGKALIHDTFPLLYDTKVLSTECCDQAMIGDNTVLGTLYTKFVENDENFVFSKNFRVANPSASDPDQLHEASYDAFMTGAVFVALAKRLPGAQGTSLYDLLSPQYNHVNKNLLGRNKLYLMLTLYTIDLENPLYDPLRHGLSFTSTYRVYGIDPSITTSDIVRCLSNMVDEVQRQVHFEIVWVDERTFLVAARARNDDETLQRHGELIYMALRRRFAAEDICTLEQYLTAKKEAEEAAAAKAKQEEQESKSMWSSLLGLFGYGKKRKSNEWDGYEHEQEPSAKRPRVAEFAVTEI